MPGLLIDVSMRKHSRHFSHQAGRSHFFYSISQRCLTYNPSDGPGVNQSHTHHRFSDSPLVAVCLGAGLKRTAPPVCVPQVCNRREGGSSWSNAAASNRMQYRGRSCQKAAPSVVMHRPFKFHSKQGPWAEMTLPLKCSFVGGWP